MTGMQYMNDFNKANVLRQLWEKLPRYLLSKWTERVSRIRSTERQIASFSDFSQSVSQSVSEQADLATDPVYSEEGISRPVDTVDKYHKWGERKTKRGRRTKFATDLSRKRAMEETLFPSSVPSAPKRTTWMNVLGERRDFIKEKGLCFGCYSSEHIAMLCRSRRSCKTCNKKHQTSLHDYNWKPEEVKTETRKSQHEESETSEKKGEDQITNVCTTICNVTEAGEVRITMGSFQYGCTTRTIQTTRYVFMLCLIISVVELSLKNIR